MGFLADFGNNFGAIWKHSGWSLQEFGEDFYPPDSLPLILGDLNNDSLLDVLDIVLMVNIIIDTIYNPLVDINEDGFVDVLDVVIIVNILID